MSRPPAKNLAQRILTAVVVLPAVVGALVVFPDRGPWLLAAILCVAGMSEAHSLLARASIRASHVSFLPGIALFFELSGLPDASRVLPVSGLSIVAVVAAALVAVRRADRLGVPQLAAETAGAVCGLLIGLGAGSFVALSRLEPEEEGTARVLFLVAVIVASDVCAYFAGHAFGRHKLSPVVSPGKTVEGAIGGLIGAALIGGLMGARYFPAQPMGVMVALGVLAAIAGIVGDLLESLFKRFVGAKDSGTLFPGHGGALDRMDAFLLAAPLMYGFFKSVS